MAEPNVQEVQGSEGSSLPSMAKPSVAAVSPTKVTTPTVCLSTTAPDAFRTPPTLSIDISHGEDFTQNVEMCDIDDGGGSADNQEENAFEICDQANIASVDPLTGAILPRLRSKCWKEYVPIFVGDNLEKGKCKHCDQEISAKRGAGTSSLLKHLKRCKKRKRALKIVENLNSTLQSPDGLSFKNWKFDPEVAKQELVRMLSLHEIPFTFLEYDGFRRFMGSLNPWFQVVCRTTARNYCMRDFQAQKLALQEMVKNADCRFSLTADLWTSNQTLGYICVTCHFINSDWKIQKRIIKFFVLETPHTGVLMFNDILNCIQYWSLEEKLFGITLDNAYANDTMVGLLKSNLVGKNALPVKGKLLHNRCVAHVINLIVKDGLKFIDSIVANIRDSVKYIKSSPSRKQRFEEIVAREEISLKNKRRPSLDVPTRWNSTYLMLETALLYRRPFASLKIQDSNYTYEPAFEEWERANVMCKLLKVFYDATKTISGSKYPTSNLYFNEMWNIRVTLQREASGVDVELGKMIQGMQNKFNKYWMKSYVSFSIPVIFYPRFKLKYVEFRLKQAFVGDAENRVDRVVKVLKGLFEEYSSQIRGGDDNINLVQLGGDHEMVTRGSDLFADWDQHLTAHLQDQASTELDRYLEETPLQRSEEFDILNWWSVNSSKYPILARIARDVLAVPASSVASEAAFSTGGRIISDFRSRLSAETVEALVCLQDWYRAESSSTKYNMESIHDFVDLDQGEPKQEIERPGPSCFHQM